MGLDRPNGWSHTYGSQAGIGQDPHPLRGPNADTMARMHLPGFSCWDSAAPLQKEYKEEDLRKAVPELEQLVNKIMVMFEDIDYMSEPGDNTEDDEADGTIGNMQAEPCVLPSTTAMASTDNMSLPQGPLPAVFRNQQGKDATTSKPSKKKDSKKTSRRPPKDGQAGHAGRKRGPHNKPGSGHNDDS